jgi:hypothetical protein
MSKINAGAPHQKTAKNDDEARELFLASAP